MQVKRRIAIAAIVLSGLAGGCAHAGQQPCNAKTFEQAGAYLDIDDFRPRSDDGVVVAAACKRWPGKDGLLLGAFAYESPRDGVKNLTVMVIADRRGTVVGAYRTTIEDDSATLLGDGSLRLDTAPYDLAPGVRAFGVDVGSDYMPHCVSGGAGPYRTLYVQEGGTLRPVMHAMATSAWHFDDKTASTCDPDPAPAVHYDFTITVDKAVTNGYADLLVTAIGRRDDGKNTGRAPFRYRLRYDGKQYPVDMMMGEFSTWQD
jgi:hypothetical protein